MSRSTCIISIGIIVGEIKIVHRTKHSGISHHLSLLLLCTFSCTRHIFQYQITGIDGTIRCIISTFIPVIIIGTVGFFLPIIICLIHRIITGIRIGKILIVEQIASLQDWHTMGSILVTQESFIIGERFRNTLALWFYVQIIIARDKPHRHAQQQHPIY